jgi:hypothetical protein
VPDIVVHARDVALGKALSEEEANLDCKHPSFLLVQLID